MAEKEKEKERVAGSYMHGFHDSSVPMLRKFSAFFFARLHIYADYCQSHGSLIPIVSSQEETWCACDEEILYYLQLTQRKDVERGTHAYTCARPLAGTCTRVGMIWKRSRVRNDPAKFNPFRSQFRMKGTRFAKWSYWCFDRDR